MAASVACRRTTEARHRVATYEQALAAAEAAALKVRDAAAATRVAAGRLSKAAELGKMADFRRFTEHLDVSIATLNESAASLRGATDATLAWPGQDRDSGASFEDCYSEELCQVAASENVIVERRESQLVSFPSVIRVLPGSRALEVDKKKEHVTRPSKVVGILQAKQKRLDKFKPENFIEALYKVYAYLTEDTSSARLMANDRPPVLLSKIYGCWNALPGAKYTKADFSRDLFVLDYKGVRTTRKGKLLSMQAATGTRRSGFFTFVGPDGQEGKYYSVKFSERG